MTSWLALAGCRWRRGTEGRGGEGETSSTLILGRWPASGLDMGPLRDLAGREGGEEEGVEEEGVEEEGVEEDGEPCRVTTASFLSLR